MAAAHPEAVVVAAHPEAVVVAAHPEAVPVAMGFGEPGSEIQAPLALVIVCGLVSSTILNMFVVPTVYWRSLRGGLL